MGLTHLLPSAARHLLRRVAQNVDDVKTAWREPRRPLARTGALTNPEVYRRSAARPASPADGPARVPSAPSPPEPGTDQDIAGRVYFADHDAEVAVEVGQSILEAGLEAGLDLEFSCTMGGCAACALQLVDGEVVYDGPNCLTDEERAEGMCLACVGRPRGRIVVEQPW